MVADSLIQTRFLPDHLERPPDEDPFTVLNVFASRLRSGFHFSAWPELADPSARDVVYAIVRGKSNQKPPHELGERLNALEDLDRAFKLSGASEQAISLQQHERLGRRVLADFAARPVGEPLRQLGQAVEELALKAGMDDEGRPRVDLDARSAWRSALCDTAASLGLADDVLAAASDIVDMHYNCVVARSLGAASCVDETVVPRIPIGLRDSAVPVEFDQRVTFLMARKPTEQVLTWQTVGARMEAGLFDTPEDRLEDLVRDRTMELVDGRRLVKVIAAAPRRLLKAAHGGIPTGAAGYVGGEQFGFFGAVLGGILGESLVPDDFLLGGKAAGRWEEMVRSRAASRLRRSVGITIEANGA